MMNSLKCPIPSAIHPEANSVDAQSAAWMRRFSLCANEIERNRLSKSHCGQLAARIAPNATRQTLQVVSDFFIWNVSFDDEYCDEGPLSQQPGELARTVSLIHRAIEVPESELHGGDRYARAMLDIRRRLDAFAAPVQMYQWLTAMRGWFLTETWKAGNVAGGRIPTLDEYATLRLYSGGAMVFPVLITIAENYAVPLDCLEDRRVKALTEIAASLVAWMADIASYGKEVAREHGGHNLISVIQHEHGRSPEWATDQATNLCGQMMELFMRLRERLTLDAPAELRRYLQTLGHYIRASFDWCNASQRYDYADLPTSVSAQDLTSQMNSSLQAPSIVSIAWWWSDAGSAQ
ncbi:hypothetical protein SAMN04490186_3224 [Pseudomonas grimontii]|jgi:hypothetical protein|uniref:Terpene synthase n=1 Tax=Pseudomonas grimontii TaxID=129847 RepID=A0A1H1G2Z1_9PSED|nr:hypothetical protein [Pseudomonas grimontii]TWR67646.1 hypothetical protein FIV39_08895 [Pseudomonas grimontii]SDR07551.1 hypothetical protein SAMN04490186_3224 [Pseudomonas grimontii]